MKHLTYDAGRGTGVVTKMQAYGGPVLRDDAMVLPSDVERTLRNGGSFMPVEWGKSYARHKEAPDKVRHLASPQSVRSGTYHLAGRNQLDVNGETVTVAPRAYRELVRLSGGLGRVDSRTVQQVVAVFKQTG